MMTILRNRADISQKLEDEVQDRSGLRKHVPIAIVKEILLARERGLDATRISREFNVETSVVEKLHGHIALPVDNADGIVCSHGIY